MTFGGVRRRRLAKFKSNLWEIPYGGGLRTRDGRLDSRSRACAARNTCIYMKMMKPVHIPSLMTLMISKPQKHSLYACVVMSLFEYDLVRYSDYYNYCLSIFHLLSESHALLMLFVSAGFVFLSGRVSDPITVLGTCDHGITCIMGHMESRNQERFSSFFGM